MRTRKIYGGLVMTAAALLCLTGCKKDEGEKIMLGTQFEKAVSAQKTYLGENNTVCWSAGDEVKVNGTAYSVSAEGIEVTEADNYYAVYPATDGNSVDENGGTVEIPASQIYHTENGKQVLNGPMAAHLDASSGILYFKNLYSLLKVTVSADDKAFTVSSITVTATGDNARALAGSYTFTFNGATTEDPNTAPIVGDIASGSSKVTLKNIATEVSAGEDKDFYLVAHPMAAQKLTVKVSGMLDGNSVAYTHTTATTVGLSRSRIGGLGINLQQLNPVMGGIGRFKIGDNKYVTFSPGNLQYLACNSTAGDLKHQTVEGKANGMFRFAEHQWDYVGDATNGTVKAGDVKYDNASIASDYTGWIDLFGWGTSEYNNKYPYMTSTTDGEYGDGESNIAGTNYDWGVYNSIYNPKTGKTDDPGTWRTLTNAEWSYLLSTSTGTSAINRYKESEKSWWIYNMVKIKEADVTNNVTGLIIYPDGVTAADLSGFTGKANFSKNSQTAAEITKAEFEKLEAMGCVFLPAAGYRNGTSVSYAGSYGDYWSSTFSNSGNAYDLHFRSGYVSVGFNYYRYFGVSVRLVKDVVE